MKQTAVLPLFPLNVVLFPHQPLPLNIFEPRYKDLVQDCLTAGQDFGVVLAQNGQLYQNGTSARIENVLERYDDGKLKILTLGKGRFRIRKILEDRSYLRAEVVYWDDIAAPSEAVGWLFQQVHQLVAEYARLSGKIGDCSLIENFSPYGFSFLLAEINMYSLTRQQEILEMTSAEQRLTEGLKSLTGLVKRLKLNQKLQKAFGSDQNFFNICN